MKKVCQKFLMIIIIIFNIALHNNGLVGAIEKGNELAVGKSGADYGSIIWRPGEVTKARLSNRSEYRPHYMEEMSVCTNPKLKEMEEEKWSWCFPMKTDLYIFAELIRGITKEELNEILFKNNYFNIPINISLIKKKEQTIRQIFKKTAQNFMFTTIKENEFYKKAWGLAEGHKGNFVVIASYWRGIGGKYNGYCGSIEFCINHDTKEYSVVDDYWDANKKGFCRPDLKGRWLSINDVKPWDGNPMNYPILEVYKGFFPMP